MTNRVLNQKPRWGRKRAHGATVNLLVGHGPKQTVTPVGVPPGPYFVLPTLGPIIARQLPPYIAYDPLGGESG